MIVSDTERVCIRVMHASKERFYTKEWSKRRRNLSIEGTACAEELKGNEWTFWGQEVAGVARYGVEIRRKATCEN